MTDCESLKACFEHQVALSPHALAVIDAQHRFTFTQLNRLGNAIAALTSRAERTQSSDKRCIGIILPHSAYLIASIFGVLKSGAAYVALETDFPPKRTQQILSQARVDTVITTTEHTLLAAGCTDIICLDDPAIATELDTYLTGTAHGADENPTIELPKTAPAYFQFTSGTTGTPKGFVITHANVLHYVAAFQAEFHPGPTDRILQVSVCTFDIFVEEVFPTLLSGGSIAIAEDAMRGDFSRLYGFIERNGVTILSAFPYLIARFNALGRFPASLRLFISGGDVLRYRYVDKLLSRVPIYNTYGPSETTVCATYFRCAQKADVLEDGTFPVGRAVLGTKVKVCDAQGYELACNQEGEICIEGNGLTEGYLDLPEETAASFSRDPVSGEKMYHSGDMGICREDGMLLFLYRKDQQVMIEGKRVEPMEVENVLSHCGGIQQAVVTAHFDEQGLAYLTAFIVADKPPRIKLGDLRAEMARELPDYMIPEYTVLLPEMPLSVNGKIARSSLPLVLKEGA